MQKLELILEEDEIGMCRLLLSETSTTLRFGKDITKSFETNKGSPQGDAISSVFFNIAFENALRDLRIELNKNNPNTEHSYSKVSFLPTEMIYADDSDFPTQSQVKNNELKTKTNNILSRHPLKVKDDRWENTTIKRSKNRTEEMEWRNTKKLGNLLGDYEDMRRIQSSNNAMESMNIIWPKQRLHINKKLKIYKTIVKSVLTYHYSPW